MIDRHLLPRSTGIGSAATATASPRWSRAAAEDFVRWLVVVLGFSIPVSVALDNVLLAIIGGCWLLGGGYREKLEGDPRQSGRARRGGALCALPRGHALHDRQRFGGPEHPLEGRPSAADPGGDPADARRAVAAARHRRLSGVDARHAGSLLPHLVRRSSRHRLAQGNAAGPGRLQGAHHAQRVHGVRGVPVRARGSRREDAPDADHPRRALRGGGRQRIGHGAGAHRPHRAHRAVHVFPVPATRRQRIRGRRCRARRAGRRRVPFARHDAAQADHPRRRRAAAMARRRPSRSPELDRTTARDPAQHARR